MSTLPPRETWDWTLPMGRLSGCFRVRGLCLWAAEMSEMCVGIEETLLSYSSDAEIFGDYFWRQGANFRIIQALWSGTSSFADSPYVVICLHLTLRTDSTHGCIKGSWHGFNYEAFATDEVRSIRWNQINFGSRHTGSGLRRCPHCAVEFRIDF